MMKRPGSVVALSCLIALIAGFMQPVTLPFFMIVIAGTVLCPVFFAWAGYAPALVYCASSVVSVYLIYDAPLALTLLPLIACPSAVIIWTMTRGMPFFRRMLVAVAAQLVFMLAIVVALYLGLGQDIITGLMERVNAWFNGLDSVMIRLMARQFAVTGAGLYMDEETAMRALAGAITVEEAREILKTVFSMLEQSLRLTLPAMILSSGILTGILAVSLPGRIAARRGDDLDYVPVRNWYLPARITLGVAVCLATALILYLARADGAESVLNAVLNAGMVIYGAQGVAAIDRRLLQSGKQAAFRAVLIALLLLFVTRLVSIIGVLSALLGSHGIISNYIKRKNEKGDDE